MPFKDISYLELWQPFCQWIVTIFAILVEGMMRNNSLYYFELGQWFRRCSVSFLIWSSGGPPVRWSGTIYATLKEGNMGNIRVKFNEIWTSRSGDVA